MMTARLGQDLGMPVIVEGEPEAVTRDSRVIFYGEDVADYGGAFKVTAGMLERFGECHVRHQPPDGFAHV